MGKLMAIVGMAGAGKEIASTALERRGWARIYFGQVTLDEMSRRGLASGEENERLVRDGLRQEHGMAAFALLNIDRIRAALEEGDVVIDGLYSWDEYLVLKEKFPQLEVVHIYASPKTRAERVARRKDRPLTAQELAGRDRAEIENSAKGGPIAMADYVIVNELSKSPTDVAIEIIQIAYGI